MGLFDKHAGKLVYISDRQPYEDCIEDEEEDCPQLPSTSKEGEDEVDRLPESLVVTNFDLVFYLFAAASYVADVVSDFVVAYTHYSEGRVWSGIFIAVFSLMPSLILNLVSFMWMLDDEYKYRRQRRPEGRLNLGLTARGILCIFQLAPLLYYFEAFLSARQAMNARTAQQRKTHFKCMVSSERDATLLRFFEAYIESAPQLMIQGFLLSAFFYGHEQQLPIPHWVYTQSVSVLLSLVSVSWSVSIQHRTLRLSRPDKANIQLNESLMQLLWRASTVISRYLVLISFALGKSVWIVPFIAAHYAVSVIHIAALQSISVGNSCMEVGLILVNGCVHIFTPFNMADGPTRWRYTVAYAVEFVEACIVFALILSDRSFTFRYKYQFAVVSLFCFVVGIGAMVVYYRWFHPNNWNGMIKIAQTDSVRRVEAGQFSKKEEDVLVKPKGHPTLAPKETSAL